MKKFIFILAVSVLLACPAKAEKAESRETIDEPPTWLLVIAGATLSAGVILIGAIMIKNDQQK